MVGNCDALRSIVLLASSKLVGVKPTVKDMIKREHELQVRVKMQNEGFSRTLMDVGGTTKTLLDVLRTKLEHEADGVELLKLLEEEFTTLSGLASEILSQNASNLLNQRNSLCYGLDMLLKEATKLCPPSEQNVESLEALKELKLHRKRLDEQKRKFSDAIMINGLLRTELTDMTKQYERAILERDAYWRHCAQLVTRCKELVEQSTLANKELENELHSISQ